MTRDEFLTELTKALSGTGLEEENYRYYSEYIDTQTASGRSEESVLSELGNPRHIAMSVKDAAGLTQDMEISDTVYDTASSGKASDTMSRASSGDRDSYANGPAQSVEFENSTENNTENRGSSPSVKAGLILILILVLLLVFLLLAVKIIGGIFAVLSPVLIPLLIVMAVIWLIKKIKGR